MIAPLLALSAADLRSPVTRAAVPLAGVEALSVEAWSTTTESRAEQLQALVSQWSPPDQWPGFRACDVTDLDGLRTRGYFGAVGDGRYVYFVPEQHGESGQPTHGVVLRCDTHGAFTKHAFSAYDAGQTDGLETRGYYGAAFDGRYVFFVPRQIDTVRYHSRLLRYDTDAEFRDPASWAAFDIGEAHSHQSAAFDGRYLYLAPGFFGDPKTEADHSGRVVRCDTQGDFKSPRTYATFDLVTQLGRECACFDGAAFDGRYIYLVPLYNGVVVRYDTCQSFTDPAGWAKFDARPLGFKCSVGAVFDGRYLYFCAYGHARIVRYDTAGEFSDAGAWSAYDADYTSGLRTTGFDGGFFDGRFVYFQPFFLHLGPGKRDNKFHSHYLRYDAARPFDDADAWQASDASATDGLHSVGYNAGAFDGRYFYAAPWQQGPKVGIPGEFVTHGIVLRCDTLGNHGSFSLRYCDYGHNGGLNAAVPGPSFLVNTADGARSIAAHRALAAGRHHLVGVYSGREISLYIDGVRCAHRMAGGQLVNSEAPLAIGHIDRGRGYFAGALESVTIWSQALAADDVAARYSEGT